MKRIVLILLIACCGTALLWAQEKCKPQFSPEEFRAKQEAFLTKKAALTKEEAAKFFPIYNELQDKKKEIHDNTWKKMRKGNDATMTEAQYGEMIDEMINGRLHSDRLEQEYLTKFKKVLSNKKIYEVQRAEMRFHRELLRGMNKKK